MPGTTALPVRVTFTTLASAERRVGRIRKLRDGHVPNTWRHHRMEAILPTASVMIAGDVAKLNRANPRPASAP